MWSLTLSSNILIFITTSSTRVSMFTEPKKIIIDHGDEKIENHSVYISFTKYDCY